MYGEDEGHSLLEVLHLHHIELWVLHRRDVATLKLVQPLMAAVSWQALQTASGPRLAAAWSDPRHSMHRQWGSSPSMEPGHEGQGRSNGESIFFVVLYFYPSLTQLYLTALLKRKG